MLLNQRTTGKAMSIPAGVGASLLVSMGITITFSLVLAWIIGSERAGEGIIGYGAMMLLLLSSYCGALFAASRIKHRRMLCCLCNGVAYFLMLIACTALFFGGQYQGVLITGLIIMSGSVAAALTDFKKEWKNSKRGVRKIRSR